MEIIPKISDITLKNDLYYYLDLFDHAFYFFSPESNIEFIAIDYIFNFDDISNFTELSKIFDFKFKNFKSSKLHRIPILVGATAFDDCKTNGFKKNNWFIPKYLLYKDFENTKLIHFTTNQQDKITTKQNYNDFLFKIKSYNPTKNQTITLKPEKLTSFDNFISYASVIKNYIESNEAIKIVPAIKDDYIINNITNATILEKISNIKNTYIYGYKNHNTLFFGASPENFLTYLNNKLIIDSLASTAPLNSNYQSILNTTKFNTEQQIVSNYILDILKNYSNEIEIDESQKYKIMGNLVHLRTIFKTSIDEFKDIFKIIDELFPTPAVCGLPKNKAFDIIKNNEPFSRDLYSGIIGYFALNCIELAVSIRCGLRDNDKISFYAGAGFIKESDIQDEYNEIINKIDTIIGILK